LQAHIGDIDPESEMLAISQHMTRTHGQGKINLELLCALRRRGHAVGAVASWADEAAMREARIDWHRVPVSPRLPTNWWRGDRFMRKAKRLLRSLGEATINNGAAVIAPSKINIAMFVHGAWHDSRWHPRFSGHWHGRYQGLYNRVQAKYEREAFAMAEHVVALSQVVKNELVAYGEIEPGKITVIPPGVNAERFRPRQDGEPNQLRGACGLPAFGGDESSGGGGMLAIFVGEIRSSRKNLDLVLRAVREMDGLHLAVVGDTSGSAYPQMAERLGIASRVYFLGQRADVAELMRGADVFVFPTHYEPFGIVVTEAMASGLPVIVTRQAGAACVVEHGREGYLLDDGDDLGELLAGLADLEDPMRRTSVGAAARRRAAALTWDAMAEQYERLLA